MRQEQAAAATTIPFDTFANQKELAELAAAWPAERLMAIWNSLPGVTPVKRFKNSNAAANRIWARIQGLGEAATPEVEFAKPKGMAYYDSYTAQAAQTALGRSLAAFYTQDDDPTVNGSADANFLARLIKTHIDSIRTTVLAAYSGAKFKLLWPLRCELRDVLLHTGRSIPSGRAPKSRRQSPVAVFGAGWIGPRIA